MKSGKLSNLPSGLNEIKCMLHRLEKTISISCGPVTDISTSVSTLQMLFKLLILDLLFIA